MTKLVTILARELGEWPEGVAAMAQDADGDVQCYGDTKDIRINERMAHGTSRIFHMYSVRGAEVASDRRTAIITREMWQAERERLEDEADAAVVRERKGEPTVPVWLGDGLPPVGAKVYMLADSDEMMYKPVIVLMHTSIGHVVWQDESGKAGVCENMHYYDDPVFRPIKSDRDRWIEAAIKVMKVHQSWKHAIGKVYDAGLAKMPEVE